MDGLDVLEDHFERTAEQVLKGLVELLNQLASPDGPSAGNKEIVQVSSRPPDFLILFISRLLDEENVVSCDNPSPQGSRKLKSSSQSILKFSVS